MAEEIIKNLSLQKNFNEIKSQCPTIIQSIEIWLKKFVDANFFQYANNRGEPELTKERINELCESMSCEGETPLKQAQCLHEFWLIHSFFNFIQFEDDLPVDEIVLIIKNKMRYLFLFQTFLLKNPSPTLRKLFLENVQIGEKLINNNSNQIQFQVEYFFLTACLYTCYYDYNKANQQLEKLQKMLHFTINFTGALGKRTRYQEDAKSQLVLNITIDDGADQEINLPITKIDQLPKNIALNDDAILEEVKFEQESENQLPCMSVEQQSYLLCYCFYLRSTRARDEILNEEMATILRATISRATSWPVLTEALFRRSILEKTSTRRLERTMAQLEELSNQCSRPEPSMDVREANFFYTRMPSRFHIEMELAGVLLQTSCVKSALDFYLKWEQWKEIIDCYIVLGRREDAEMLIRDRLASRGDNVELLCALGDVTQDRTHYVKAWEVSCQRSARAMRNLGMMFMMVDRNNKEASSCFEKSLDINPLQVGLWFTYGCCCLQLEEYVKAENAFKRCLQIESDNFEAWNNCAMALIKRGEKENAFTLLKEAIKCNYENWRLWENFMTIATDIGEFSETIRAYNKLLELNRKTADVLILDALVKAVNNDLSSRNGPSAASLRSKLTELFGGVTSQSPDNADVWRLYASLLRGMSSPKSDTKQRIIQYLQKSHRCLTQHPQWDSDVDSCVTVVNKTCSLARDYLSVLQDEEVLSEDVSLRNQLVASCRLMLRNVSARVKKTHCNVLTDDYPKCLQDPVADLNALLNEVDNVMKK